MKLPATLYQAKRCVRSGPDAVCASAACSVGTKTLTSPADGFSVPSTATTSSGQKAVRLAKPIPVASMSAAAPSSTPSRVAVAGQPERDRERRRAEQRAGHDRADLERREPEPA